MYHVQLQDFEGPLDLLLFFIKRDELDVFDIPIAEITDEFLAYVRVMQEIDLDGVGDFIYMAAVLISIKAQMLLPTDEEGRDEEAVDPRRELARRLMEYMRFKEAAGDLEQRQRARLQRYTRGAASAEKQHYESKRELDLDASVYDLASALRNVLTALPDPDPVHAVEREAYSVEEQQTYVLERVLEAQTVSFEELVRERTKPFVVATFLAVLEMARQRLVTISVAASNRDFYLLRPDAESNVAAS